MDDLLRQHLHALQASEARFRTLIERNADGIVLVGCDGVVRFVNPAAEALLGRPACALVGETFGVPVVPGETTEVDILRGAGRDSTVAEMRVVETTWEGQTAFLASLRDVSERKRLEEQLRQRAEQLADADRRKDEFLAMLAHELRNPLGPIRNALQILALPSIAKEDADRARSVAERQVQHMARLIDDLLDVSRVTRGKIQLRKEVLDIRDLATRVTEAVRPNARARGHELCLSLPPEPVWVEADPTRLEQVVTNLLHNAIKYTDPGGHIGLTVQGGPEEATVRVCDTGVGIAANMLPHVFDLFAQVDRTLDRTQGGLGIGLTLVKRLVELHGGRIEAHSAGLGQGSQFTVRLRTTAPLERVGPRQDEVPSPLQQPSGCGKRVLLVEDNLDAAQTLSALLRVWGYQVRVVHDGQTALSVAEDYCPEAVLLDIGLPGLNGYEVARHLRKTAATSRALIVALTGYGREEDSRLCKEVGFDAHLIKPVDPCGLQNLLASVGADGQGS